MSYVEADQVLICYIEMTDTSVWQVVPDSKNFKTTTISDTNDLHDSEENHLIHQVKL